MIKTLIEKLKTLRLYFVSKRYVKKLDDMTLFEQWQYSRDNFQHYAIRSMYDYDDGFRTTVSQEERNWCAEQANIWDGIIKELRLKIIERQSNVGELNQNKDDE
jgi:hypothetical protein